MWFIGVEVEQETSAPPPKKNPGSAPASPCSVRGRHVMEEITYWASSVLLFKNLTIKIKF